MEIARYTNKPDALRIQRMGDYFDITVAADIHYVEEAEQQWWEAKTHSFTAKVGEIDLERLDADPAAFMDYIPASSREVIKQQRIAAVQEWMDKTAQAHGYDSIFTACTYANSTNARFKAEAEACIAWRDAVWVAANELAERVMAGEQEMPDVTALLMQLPQIDWPVA